MEKFMQQRESLHQDDDFNDVFGGPPRRFSLQEARDRSSPRETKDSGEERSLFSRRCPKETPVFGSVSMSRRHHLRDDFFFDIFRGDESSSPQRSNFDDDAFPSSMVMSPAGISTLKPELLGSSLRHEEIMDDDVPVFDQDPLPHGSSLRYQYSPLVVTPSRKSSLKKLKNEAKTAEDDAQHSFHFSFYKWAGKEVPVMKLLPILAGNDLKSRNRAEDDRNFSNTTRKAAFEAVNSPEFLRSRDVRSQEDAPDFSDETPVYEEIVKPNDFPKRTDAEVDKSGAKGRIKKFVEIFSSQAADSRNKPDVRKSQSRRMEEVPSVHCLNKASINEPKERGGFDFNFYADHIPDDPLNSECLKHEKEEEKKAPIYANHSYSTTKEASPSEMPLPDSRVSLENDSDPFEVNFMVEVLSGDPEDAAPTGGLDDTNALDAKIRQWSAGKSGNIHSLLSTLQFVLWPGSGWKPIPLADLIEANSVKKAYQKALLHLHPDKLQQKNAAFHQKYIAGEVFDILQEAWDHFNTMAPL